MLAQKDYNLIRHLRPSSLSILSLLQPQRWVAYTWTLFGGYICTTGGWYCIIILVCKGRGGDYDDNSTARFVSLFCDNKMPPPRICCKYLDLRSSNNDVCCFCWSIPFSQTPDIIWFLLLRRGAGIWYVWYNRNERKIMPEVDIANSLRYLSTGASNEYHDGAKCNNYPYVACLWSEEGSDKV